MGLVVAVVAALIAAALFVASSLRGRGTRPAVGETRFADSGGFRIAYHDAGAGPPVVMLASWARPGSDFNELAGALHEAGFRTLAVESRGIGGSEGSGYGAKTTLRDLANDVAAVLDAAGVPSDQPVDLIGHAFGNRVARTFATVHPVRTRSVVLVAAGGRMRQPEPLTQALLRSSLTFLPFSVREPALRLAFFADGNEIPDHWRTGWCLWGGLGQSHAARSGKREDFWAAGSAPILVVQAEQDTIAPPEEAGLALAAEYPERVTLVRVEQAGHALLPEQPEPIASAVIAFLRAR